MSLLGRIVGILGKALGRSPGSGAPVRPAPPGAGRYGAVAATQGRAGPPMVEELSHNEQILASGAKVALASSWQENLWFDWRTITTFLETKSGGIYAYKCAIEVAVKWVEASSPGRYWWSHIVPYYSPARRVVAGHRGKGRPNIVRIVRQRTP